MVNYPDLSSLGNSSSISNLAALPSASYPFYWTIMIGAIWIILTLTMYFRDKSLQGKGNILSSMAIASFAAIVLSAAGSWMGIVSVTSQLPILVFGVVILVVWIFSS